MNVYFPTLFNNAMVCGLFHTDVRIIRQPKALLFHLGQTSEEEKDRLRDSDGK